MFYCNINTVSHASMCILLLFTVLPSSAAAKNIVVLMDGTWQDSSNGRNADSADPNSSTIMIKQDSTNIARMWDLLEKDVNQRLIYIRGIGLSDSRLRSTIDGAIAKTAQQKVSEAYELISAGPQKWMPGDKLYIYGFSRGAATARILARKIESDGIRHHMPVPIKFMGLFDTVAAIGVPSLTADRFTDITSYRKEFDDQLEALAIPGSVSQVVHLVALHEDRAAFAPTLITLMSRNQSTKVKEVWMGGNHGDIGGGWTDATENPGPYRRRKIALRYMLENENGLKRVTGWAASPDVMVRDGVFGKIHGWKDYHRGTRVFKGKLARTPVVLHGQTERALIHPTARR